MRSCTSAGFSFIELLVVLVIMTGLIRLAAPALQHVVLSAELELLTHRLHGALRFTRLHAVVEHQSLSLCGSSNMQQVDGHWNDGWVVMNHVHSQIKRTIAVSSTTVDIRWRGGFGRKDCIRFNSQGFTAGQQGSFTLIARATGQQRQLVVSRSGRIRQVSSSA